MREVVGWNPEKVCTVLQKPQRTTSNNLKSLVTMAVGRTLAKLIRKTSFDGVNKKKEV